MPEPPLLCASADTAVPPATPVGAMLDSAGPGATEHQPISAETATSSAC